MRLNEFSPNNLKGSWTKDLITSKLWLINALSKINQSFDVIYILGSWYGNLAMIMAKTNKLNFEKIINVDNDPECCAKAEYLAKKLNLDNAMEFMVKDANLLDYRQLTKNSVVINTSCDDIDNDLWFENIPKNVMVVLQARSNNTNAANQFETIDDLLDRYPMSKIYFNGQKKLQDPEVEYKRFMIIGKK